VRKLGFFLREAFRALSRSAAPSLAAMLTILITALVLGVFIPVVQATTGTANQVREKVVVDVYVKDGATDADRGALRQRLIALPSVKSVRYIPKDEALAAMKKRNREAFALLGRNPLPDAFRVTPNDAGQVNAIAAALKAPPGLKALDEVRNRRQDTDKIVNATGLVKGVTAGLAILFVLASTALVANTIRLSIFARRREVEVMRLVGATNWFIRWPFVIEGVVVGLMGGVLAVLLLLIGKETVVDPLAHRFALLAAPDTISFGLLAALLLGACVAVSAIGSGVTLRRYLRV
jgi:cell division transport system permease protein